MEVLDSDLATHPFFRDNIFFHTHIQKCAGTTLVESFKKLLGPNRVYDMRSPHVAGPPRLSPHARGAICVLTGHFHYGTMDAFFCRKPQYIASVRHPVARFFSYYKYVSSRPNHPDHSRLAGKTFDEVVAAYAKEKHNAINNPMSRTVTGSDSPTPQMVIEHVRRNYLIVAPQQGVDQLVRILFNLFGEGQKQVVRRSNVGGYNDGPSNQEAAVILAMNQVDLILYEYACREFDSALERMVRRVAG